MEERFRQTRMPGTLGAMSVGRSGEIRGHNSSRSIFCVILESFGFRNSSGDHQTGPIMDVPELSNRARLVLIIGNLDD